MAEDWKAGDIAECIDVRQIQIGRYVYDGGKYLIKGMIYIVAEVIASPRGVLLDVNSECGPKLAQRFRKVPPLDEEEPVAKAEPVREVEPA